ncbi:MAG: hypothetical protein KDG52_11070 [Rhodocyclaceae bacterium]|nr:hypothetical protein [Rhodocyclaceae bacterium]
MFRSAACRLLLVAISPLSCAAAEPPLHLARLQALPLPSMRAESPTPARSPDPTRAYAIDAVSFYFDGLRVVAVGLDGAIAQGELGRQRLQAALDAGEVRFDGRRDAASGELRARVWIDGRPLAEVLR